jgi:hypothetical protein
VLNLRFAGDVDRYGAEARAAWGGALCVSEAARPLHELEAIHEEVHAEHEPLTSSVDEVHGVVELEVPVLDPGLQAALDDRYGEGTVVARGVLRLVE